MLPSFWQVLYPLLMYIVAVVQEWSDLGVKQLVLSTPDFFSAPTQENISAGVRFILDHRNSGHSVYVHCKAGRTRSAVVVACYLIQV